MQTSYSQALAKVSIQLKKKRSNREQFFLQGTKLCYTAHQPDKDDSSASHRGREIRNKLSQLTGNNTYYDHLEHKFQTRDTNYKDLEIIDALFCVYDVTALFSEDLPSSTSDKLEILLNRIYSNPQILKGSKARQNVLYDLINTEGFLNSGRTPDSEELFQLKVSELELCLLKDPSPLTDNCEVEEDLLHELFVSFLFTNRLRKIVPNFQLCYAGLKFNKPSVPAHPVYKFKLTPSSATGIDINDTSYQYDEDFNSNNNSNNSDYEEENSDQDDEFKPLDCTGICPCDTSQTIDYLLQEKLHGSTMTMALRNCSLLEFLSWMTQIILSLELGVIHFGFTHNNLHTDNITIAPTSDNSDSNKPPKKEILNKEILIPYFHNNDILYVRVISLAIITNFDLAHVKHMYVDLDDDGDAVINKSEHFGPLGHDDLGIFHNETRPFYDVYKVLMWSLNILKKYNSKVYLEARKISKFFGFELAHKLEKALKDEEKLTYIYSTVVSDLEKTRSLKDLLDLMFREFPAMSKLVTRKSDLVDPQTIKLRTSTMSPNSVSNLDGLDVLQCNGYCPVSGFKSEDFNSNLTKRSEVVLTLSDLNIFSVHDLVERHNGLKKRMEELTRLTGSFCKATEDSESLDENDKLKQYMKRQLCQPSSEELIEATREFNQFKTIINYHKQDLYLQAAKDIEHLLADINTKIRINNTKVMMYKTKQTDALFSEVQLDESTICREQSIIAGKIVLLVNRVTRINYFREIFDVSKIPFNVRVEALDRL